MSSKDLVQRFEEAFRYLEKINAGQRKSCSYGQLLKNSQ